MLISNKEFQDKINLFLSETGMSATAFGIKAKNDPRFVSRVLGGQEVKEDGKKRVIDFIDSYKQEKIHEH